MDQTNNMRLSMWLPEKDTVSLKDVADKKHIIYF